MASSQDQPSSNDEKGLAESSGSRQRPRDDAFIQDLLQAPLLSTPLLQHEHFAAPEAELPEQPEEAAAAALAAASFLAARARRHLGACAGKGGEDTAAPATSAADASGSSSQLRKPPMLWPRPQPPRAHRSEPVLSQGPPPPTSSTEQNTTPFDDRPLGATAGSSDASSANLSQLEAALSKLVHLGEEALGGVSTVALESIHLTTEGLQKAREQIIEGCLIRFCSFARRCRLGVNAAGNTVSRVVLRSQTEQALNKLAAPAAGPAAHRRVTSPSSSSSSSSFSARRPSRSPSASSSVRGAAG